MKRIIVLVVLLLAVTSSSAVIRRADRTRRIISQGKYYRVPRSVGVNSQIRDTGIGNAQWWKLTPSQPLWQTFDWIRDEFDITAIGTFLRSHPWNNSYTGIQNFENIRMAFRTPGIDIIQITPQYWGNQGHVCNSDGTTKLGGITDLSYPTRTNYSHLLDALDPGYWNYEQVLDYYQSIYDGLYKYYSKQEKHIFVSSTESGWQIMGGGCRSRTEGFLDVNYDWCLHACEAGTLVPYDVSPLNASCWQMCLDMSRVDKANYMLRVWNDRQSAAEQARLDNPTAALKAWHVIEVNFFDTESWQFIVPLCDIIPKMDSPPDFIALSLYSMAGDPVEALHYAMQCTGLPAYRFYLSEVGRRVDSGGQYDRIYNYTDRLFEEGMAFALVWSLDTELSYEPNWPWSVIDPETYEWRDGMYAIRDLNEKWRQR